jgi:hypothetical protein
MDRKVAKTAFAASDEGHHRAEREAVQNGSKPGFGPDYLRIASTGNFCTSLIA